MFFVIAEFENFHSQMGKIFCQNKRKFPSSLFLFFFFDFRSTGKRATFSKGIGTIMMKYWYPIHISFMRLAKHPSLLRTFGFSAISTYDSYLPSIFGRNASIWCYFKNILEGRFLKSLSSKDDTQSRSLKEAEKKEKKYMAWFIIIIFIRAST